MPVVFALPVCEAGGGGVVVAERRRGAAGANLLRKFPREQARALDLRMEAEFRTRLVADEGRGGAHRAI